MGETDTGWKYYIDLDRIRKNGGYFYVWRLEDRLKPNEWGTMSAKVYYEIDCKAFRYKKLTYIFYKQPMGEGEGDSQTALDQEWKYPSPDSMSESILNRVCAQ